MSKKMISSAGDEPFPRIKLWNFDGSVITGNNNSVIVF